MKTIVEKLDPTRAKLTITVSPDDLKPSITHAYQHIAEQVAIPGFRKGKVPPPIIDQRVGRAEVLQHAVTEGVDRFYRLAVEEKDVKVVGRPEADIVSLPSEKDFSGDLVIAVEVPVRPEFTLPKVDGLTLTVDSVNVSDIDVADELDALRTRFATLKTVDRPAKKGDFVTLDLVAKIGDEVVDEASSLSYEVGSGELLEGMDDAVETLTAGESTSFESVLLGGDHEGEPALIAVTVTAVKERELPALDDDFAQLASQFDTVEELKADTKEQVARMKSFDQGAKARDLVIPTLTEGLDIPVPQQIIDDEVKRHLEAEGREDDAVHGAEVAESAEKAFRTQFVLDQIVEAEQVKVSQGELTTHLVRGAAQYGMTPNDYAKALDEAGQIPSIIAEVARNKALAIVLDKAKVVDPKGKKVDVSQFVKSFIGEPEGDEISAPQLNDHAGHTH